MASVKAMIFHSSFSIFHFPSLRAQCLVNEKWKMTNGNFLCTSTLNATQHRASIHDAPGTERLKCITPDIAVDHYINCGFWTGSGALCEDQARTQEVQACDTANGGRKTTVCCGVVKPQSCCPGVMPAAGGNSHAQPDAEHVARAKSHGSSLNQIDRPENCVIKATATTGRIIELTRTYEYSVLEDLGQQVKPGANIVTTFQPKPDLRRS